MIARARPFRSLAAAIPLMLTLAAVASAQAPYPNHNITLVLPFAAGSGTDTTTRLIGKELGTKKLPVVATGGYAELVRQVGPSVVTVLVEATSLIWDRINHTHPPVSRSSLHLSTPTIPPASTQASIRT